MLQPTKIFILAVVIAPVPFLTSYSLYSHAKPILILINVQYLQNAAFGLERGLNGQNYFSSGSNHHIN